MLLNFIKKSIRWRILLSIVLLFLLLRGFMSGIQFYEGKELTRAIVSDLEAVDPAKWFLNPGDAAAFIKARMDDRINQSLVHQTLIAAGSLVVLIFLLVRIASSITRPIAELTRIARSLATGRFSEADQLPVDLQDETGDLSRALFVMSKTLEKNQDDLKKKIEEVETAERRLKLFFENASDMLAIEGFDMKIVQINRAYAGALGYTPSEMIGRSCVEYFHPDDLEPSLEKLVDLKSGRPVLGFENRMRHKNGEYRRIAWNIVSDPAVEKIYVIGWDVTEYRGIEEQIVRATADEQERMARDLHDSVGQILTGLAFKAKGIEEDLRAGVKLDPSRATEIVALANRVIEETRSIARGIDPVELQHGLSPSLEYLAHSTREVFGIDCRLHQDGEDREIEKSKAVHLYRIAQEAVTNSIRHGQASRITINLTCSTKNITLTVEDNGVSGTENHGSAPGQGKRIMQYRAQLIGGNISYLTSSIGGRIMKCVLSIS